jgi:hypothetical protein
LHPSCRHEQTVQIERLRLTQHAAFNCSIATRCQERSRSDGYPVHFGVEYSPMVMGMLKKAVKKRGNAAAPMLHSDQGWHYRMQPYRAALARYGMKQSMSRKGNCFDNAAMESFFGTLKAEYFHLTDFGHRRIAGRPEGLHRLLQPAPHQIETWWTESRGISNASGKKLTLQRPTFGGQFKPGAIQ